MTDIVTAADDVYAQWLSFVTTSGTGYVTLFGNEDSVGGVKPEDGASPWYRVTLREAAGGRANLNGVSGTRKYERLGFLAVQVFVPTNTGEKLARELAESARAVFEDARHPTNNDIIYLNATIRPQPPDGKWYAVLLETEVEITDRK